MLQIGLCNQFHGAVHVSVGDRYQACGAAGARNLDGCCVITGWIPKGIDLERDTAGGGLSRQQIKDDGAGIGATNNDRATTDFDASEFILINTGTIGGMSDIDGDCDIRLDCNRWHE